MGSRLQRRTPRPEKTSVPQTAEPGDEGSFAIPTWNWKNIRSSSSLLISVNELDHDWVLSWSRKLRRERDQILPTTVSPELGQSMTHSRYLKLKTKAKSDGPSQNSCSHFRCWGRRIAISFIYILNRVLGIRVDLEFAVWLKLFLNSDPPTSTSWELGLHKCAKFMWC